jgi:hypothetical protein
LIQGIRHPSTAGIQTIRSRIREISIDAGARRSNGSPLVLLPHDCRRVFASEHLNNNTPVHIIQALLGHASPDTVMIYAKLYPSQLIEEYRKTVRSLYNAYYGEDGLKNPTAEEWAAFTASCNLRDMGTHLCALPTGEHCPKGLICLGCAHAQPKKSAVPIFRRMLASHERSLVAARGHGEPAGQIASREMEIVRIKGALQRAEDGDGGNLIMQNLTLFGVAAAQGKPVAGLHSCDENQWFVDSKLLLFRRLQEGKFASEPFSG